MRPYRRKSTVLLISACLLMAACSSRNEAASNNGDSGGSTAGSSAGNAAESAAGDAAGNTAGNTAGSTAGNSAGSTAGNSAGNIAGSTADNTAPDEPHTLHAPGASLEPHEVYAQLAPSVAFVETPLATGTAVLVRPDVALTSAHVVWPFESVRVVFPDGSETLEARVIARDEMADLALLDVSQMGAGTSGPGAAGDGSDGDGTRGDAPSGGAAPSPVPVGDGTELPIGSEVYLVGYPGESEEYPQPAISRGILSRLRHWDAIDMPYLQSDADIAGGQSGGVLASSDGRVIGISSLIFGESAFGLSASAPDALERIDRMLAGEDVDGVESRPIPTDPGRTENTATLDGYWDEAVFVLEAPYGTLAEITAVGVEDTTVAGLDPYGDLLFESDSSDQGSARGSVVTRFDGPHFIVVNLDGSGSAAISSNEPLRRMDDPDDGAELAVGSERIFMMDYPGDFDHFSLLLTPGQRVTVTVDTANFSPELIIESPGPGGVPPGSDTWIGGPLGLTASTTFTANAAGEYTVVVDDVEGIGTGGYRLAVEQAR